MTLLNIYCSAGRFQSQGGVHDCISAIIHSHRSMDGASSYNDDDDNDDDDDRWMMNE
jgi:hypothetical protein